MGQSPDSENYTDDSECIFLVQGNADIKNGFVSPRLRTKQITKIISHEHFILTVRAPVGDLAKTLFPVVIGRGAAGIKGNDFLFYHLQNLQRSNYWVNVSTGSTFQAISGQQLKSVDLTVPIPKEQDSLGSIFLNLDTAVTLQQRKCRRGLYNLARTMFQRTILVSLEVYLVPPELEGLCPVAH